MSVACIDSVQCVRTWLFRAFRFFFKQKTAYEMRISDWSSDVCSSDLIALNQGSAMTEPVLARFFDGAGGSILRDDMILAPGAGEQIATEEIGRASCRERVCQYV